MWPTVSLAGDCKVPPPSSGKGISLRPLTLAKGRGLKDVARTSTVPLSVDEGLLGWMYSEGVIRKWRGNWTEETSEIHLRKKKETTNSSDTPLLLWRRHSLSHSNWANCHWDLHPRLHQRQRQPPLGVGGWRRRSGDKIRLAWKLFC